MNNTDTQKRQSAGSFYLLLCTVYSISYITRTSFGTVVAEMEQATGFSRSLLSLSLTGTFITYGVGQIISGLLVDRFSPKRLLEMGLCVSALMNLLLPFCQNPYQMLAAWCVNGLAVSFIWPPMVRIMTMRSTEEEYAKYGPWISWGSNGGKIAIYLIAPLLIHLLSWKAVFFFATVCGLTGLLLSHLGCEDVPTSKRLLAAEKERGGSEGTHHLLAPVMLGIFALAVLLGVFKDGVQTWMPSYISQTHHLSSVISILTGVLLPIMGIVFVMGASYLYRKKVPNVVVCVGITFAVGTLAALGCFFWGDKSAVAAVLFTAVLVGAGGGANYLITFQVPVFFKKYGNTATAAGVVNAMVYVGSAASTYGFAALSEHIGWGMTVLSWVLIAFLGAVICLICAKPWKQAHGK